MSGCFLRSRGLARSANCTRSAHRSIMSAGYGLGDGPCDGHCSQRAPGSSWRNYDLLTLRERAVARRRRDPWVGLIVVIGLPYAALCAIGAAARRLLPTSSRTTEFLSSENA